MKRTFTVTLDDDTALALAGLCARHGFEPEAIIASEIASSMAQVGDESDQGEYERHIADRYPDFIATHPCAAMVPTVSMRSFAALKMVADISLRTPSQILENKLSGIVRDWFDGGGYGNETLEIWLANEVYEPELIPRVNERIKLLAAMGYRVDLPKHLAEWDALTTKLEAGEMHEDPEGIIEKPLRNYLLALDPGEISDNELLRAVAHRLASKAA